MFGNLYKKRKVLITGHTGFKGSWLCLWLLHLGAEVVGYALPPPTEPNHYSLLNLDMDSIHGDVRDLNHLKKVFKKEKPEVVFHLAAQALVGRSYRDPIETYHTNILGTANVLEACRHLDSVRAVVIITSDKCYKPRGGKLAYKEEDRLGGVDPYSASKACVEIIVESFRTSFLNLEEYGKRHQTLIACGRAGNVIGGGDWAENRLIPDLMRAMAKRIPIHVRNFDAIRPWQHVLEPLSGYLLLGQKLHEGSREEATAWNFGPPSEKDVSVADVIGMVKKVCPDIEIRQEVQGEKLYETKTLRLDSSKALNQLGWSPVWDIQEAVHRTIEWYVTYYGGGTVRSIRDLNQYLEDALKKKAVWTQ